MGTNAIAAVRIRRDRKVPDQAGSGECGWPQLAIRSRRTG